MNNALITVIALPTFTRNIRALIKKYRNILKDIQPIIEQLENGEILGEQLAGIGYPVFKLWLRNSDNQSQSILNDPIAAPIEHLPLFVLQIMRRGLLCSHSSRRTKHECWLNSEKAYRQEFLRV
jgi:hypothetical protein